MYRHLLFSFLGAGSVVLAIQTINEAPTPSEDSIEVIVSANRGYAQDPLDIPQSLSVVDNKELNAASVYYNLEEALRECPNIGFGQASQSFSAHQGGNTSSNYWQQGFTIRGLGNARVLVLTDGIRQSGQGIGYGGGNLSLYDMPAIERVEILRGPASVLYGTDALGGVVHIISKEPVFKKEKDIRFGSRITFDGSRRLWRRSITLEAGSPDHAIVLGATDTQAERPKAPEGTVIDNGSFQSHGFWVKTLHQLTLHSQLKFLANSTQVEDIEIAERNILKSFAKPATPTTAAKPAVYMTTPLQISIPHYRRTAFGAEWCLQEYSDMIEQARVGLYWQQLRRRFSWKAPFSGPKALGFPEQASQRLTQDKGNTIELQPMVVLNFNDHTLTGGVDLGYDDVKLKSRRQDTSLNGTTLLDTHTIDADAYQLRSGIYLQDRWDLHPIELTVGGRLDNFYVKDRVVQEGNKKSGLSGSVSMLGHLNAETSAYVTLAAGYRAPDLGERFQDTTITLHQVMHVVGNPKLRSETSQSIEAGLKHRSEHFKAEVAVFLNDIQHYIGTLPDQTKLKYQYQNVGDLTLYGTEGQITWMPTKNLEFFAGLGKTYTNHKNLITLPSWMSHFGASYECKIDQSFLKSIKPMIKGTAFAGCKDTINKMYVGNDTKNPIPVPYPGFLVWDAQVSFAFKTQNRLEGDLTIGVKNCFNTTHYMPFFGNPYLRLNPQPARGFFMTASINF